jgi:hypothetical protein
VIFQEYHGAEVFTKVMLGPLRKKVPKILTVVDLTTKPAMSRTVFEFNSLNSMFLI